MSLDKSSTKTLKLMFNDQLEYIDCALDANYEKCIEMALERFEIPSKFKSSVQITNDCNEVFEKSTFEYYNLLFPSPASIFTLKIKDDQDMRKLHFGQKRKPFVKLSNKRKLHDENVGVPVTRQNCFLGSLSLFGHGSFESDEQVNKKQKTADTKPKELGVLRRTISRRTIRI